MLTRLIALSTLGIVGWQTSAAVQAQTPPQTPTGSVVVVVAYADGRRAPILVGPHSGGISTSKFPRVEAWTPPAGQLPVTGLKFMCAHLPVGVSVSVSLLRGSAPQQEEAMQTVLVTPTQSVTVDGLRRVGVEPVTLTLSDIKMPAVDPPAVPVPSPDLQVTDVTVSPAPIPGYGITFENHSSKAVRTLVFAMSPQPIHAVRTGREGQPLIEAGAKGLVAFDMAMARPAPDGTISADPFARIAVTAIVWADGSFSGSAAEALPELISDYSRRSQLARVVAELTRMRATAGATPAALRTVLGDLPGDASDDAVADVLAHLPPGSTIPEARVRSMVRVAFLFVRKSVLDDLTDFESAPAGAGTFQAWLNTNADRYLRWHDRLTSR